MVSQASKHTTTHRASVATASGWLAVLLQEDDAALQKGGAAEEGSSRSSRILTFLTEPANGDAGLFAAHDKIGVVLRHDG